MSTWYNQVCYANECSEKTCNESRSRVSVILKAHALDCERKSRQKQIAMLANRLGFQESCPTDKRLTEMLQQLTSDNDIALVIQERVDRNSQQIH